MRQEEPLPGDGWALSAAAGEEGVARPTPTTPDAGPASRRRRLLAWLRRLRGPMSVEANLRGVACPAGSAPWQGLPAAGRPPGLMEPAPGGRAARASLEASVTDLLGGLGATSDRVAESLRRAGVRGTPGRPASAPMAVFLAAVVGADPAVRAVTATADEVRIERHARWRSTVTVRFPPPVAAFARAFDVGFYAGLRG